MFNAGDKVEVTSGMYKEQRATIIGDYAVQLHFENGGTGVVSVDLLRLVPAPASYTIDLAPGQAINWTAICNGAAPETDIIKVTRPSLPFVFLFRADWLLRAPQDMRIGIVDWTVKDVLEQGHSSHTPNNWREYQSGMEPDNADRVVDNIATIRAGIAAPRQTVTVEVV